MICRWYPSNIPSRRSTYLHSSLDLAHDIQNILGCAQGGITCRRDSTSL
uniref:Uncharacterized protein n=1 Tax=Manihot esculenta TaxID=3983 RepID=A0A2C9USR5_MANES